MASREAIISWGRANGWDIAEDAARLPSGLRAAFDAAAGDSLSDAANPTVAGLEPDDDTERAPVIKKETVAERARTAINNARKTGTTPKRKNKATRPRVPVDRIISRGWEILARVVTPVHMPVGRVLQMQAPVAGALLEDTVKGTLADKVLQPLARAGEGGELIAAMAGPPLLVAALSTPQGGTPQAQAFLVPALKECLRLWIDVAQPKLQALEAKEKKFQEEYGETIDGMIAQIFAPPEGVPYTPEDNG